MSGLAKDMMRSGVVALLIVAPLACAASEPPPGPAHPTVAEKQALTAAYTPWRHALICATTAAPRPVPGAMQEAARGEKALRRARARGLGPLTDSIDADYRRIDAEADWSCGDGDMLAPKGFETGRLAKLKSAVDNLSAAVDAAIDE